MIDLLFVLLGKKTCSWCNESNRDAWFIKLLGIDGYISEYNRLQRFLAWIYYDFSTKLGVWKLAQWWHWRNHKDYLSYLLAYDKITDEEYDRQRMIEHQLGKYWNSEEDKLYDDES